MLKPVEARSKGRHSLAQWLAQTAERGMRVKYQVQGNDLHLLYEGSFVPEQSIVLDRLLPALKHTDPNTLIPFDQPQIYQVLIYGRELGQPQPSWTVPIDLRQVDFHLEQLYAAATPSVAVGRLSTTKLPDAGDALILSNRSLARRGDAIGIARYLSETLSALGVAVRVTVKTIPYGIPAGSSQSGGKLRRLWITCEANYSPDPTLVGEPLAQKLRDLELEGFRDAIALIQVWGEAKPDWVLRVDLTPTREVLRDLARWGDVEAISRLLNQVAVDQGVCLDTIALKESTLHLCWRSAIPLASQRYPKDKQATSRFASAKTAPDQPLPDQSLVEKFVDLLAQLAPQGIHAAMFYGQSDVQNDGQSDGKTGGQATGQDTLAWVKWVDLPAGEHPALAESALTLAQQGDWGAIDFLLNRLLNPDLDRQLATGGIRLQLLPKQDLLHIMTDAPVCPQQRQVVAIVTKFLRQLNLPTLTGIRIYGRRSGQKRPLWSEGVDFAPRLRLVPEVTPEFAATDAFIGDLIARSDHLMLRPDLTVGDLQTGWQRLRQQTVQRIQHSLTRSHLFVTHPETQEIVTLESSSTASSIASSPTSYQGIGTGLVWSMVGVLLVVQTDWMVGHWLARAAQTAPAIAASVATSSPALPRPIAPFTAQTSSHTVTASSEQSVQAKTTVHPIASFATFNSWQLNEKVALYTQRVAEEGAPDVLIVGSSRALRGVDPAQLRRSLAKLGYANVSVFNFGINGATAQVVDLILERILKPEQLPKLIIWADGARAFNSGTDDVTYNGIVASAGYRQLAETPLSPSPSIAEGTSGGMGAALADSYQTIDRWLSDHLAAVSLLHSQRDQFKSVLQHSVTTVLPHDERSVASGIPADPTASPSIPSQGQGMIDFNGFLPLSLRFNPTTYYQQYARVSGEYDSDYESFQISGIQETALNSLLRLTHDRQIPLIFVNLPLTQEYLDPARLQYEQTFKQYMLRLSLNQQGLVFRDLGEIWLTQDDYFSDPSHLNRYGANEVSQRLAEDVMIPWNEARSGK